MIDETGPAGAQSAPADKTINAKGNNDQWQRHLEKAWFERQRAAMPGEPNGMPHTAPVRSPATGHSVAQAGSEATDPATAGRASGRAVQPAEQPLPARGNAAAPGVATHANTSTPLGTATRDQAVVQTQHRHTGAPAPSARSFAAWRGALPASSSASVLATEHGVHLVIRDASLSAADARKLLRRLRALFAAEGQRLWTLTLNGQRLWQAHNRERAVDRADVRDAGVDPGDAGINRNF